MEKAKIYSKSKKRMHKTGLVVGKFYPPHNGHHYLIDFALERSEKVDVLVVENPSHRIPAKKRMSWLQQRHPDATIHIITDIGKDDDSEAWAEHTTAFLGYAPDAVFSSEDYGDEYAKAMGAKHNKVDRERVHVPIASRHIRADILRYWKFMLPAVRGDFAVRVCVLGAESTGTTTLSKALAEHYEAPWVPEYGRLYTEALMYAPHEWQSREFPFIAREQRHMEDELAGQSKGLLICDTDAFATGVWHERYFGSASEEVSAISSRSYPALYIITDDTIPFVQDGIRDGEHIRRALHRRFIEAVASTGVPFIIAKGTVTERLGQATKNIDRLLRRKITI